MIYLIVNSLHLKNPNWFDTNITLDDVYNMAKKAGFDENNFMLYGSQNGNVYIVPNVDSPKELEDYIFNYDLDSFEGF